MLGMFGVVGLAALVSIALVRQPRPTDLSQVQAAKLTAATPAQAQLAADVADLWRVDGPGPAVPVAKPATPTMDSLGAEMADLWNVGGPRPAPANVLAPPPTTGPLARAVADLWRIDVPAKGDRDRVAPGHADTAPNL